VILNSQAVAAAQTLVRLLGPEIASYQQVRQQHPAAGFISSDMVVRIQITMATIKKYLR
jgi:hypothetical protein